MKKTFVSRGLYSVTALKGIKMPWSRDKMAAIRGSVRSDVV